LGQVEYVFCDKTGTLTKNQLKFHSAVIGNQFYEINYNNDTNEYTCKHLSTDVDQMEWASDFLEEDIEIGFSSHRLEISDYSRLLQEYFMCLLVCNSIGTIHDDNKAVTYES
jgi:magnesium-transporting ATPase (P-type)